MRSSSPGRSRASAPVPADAAAGSARAAREERQRVTLIRKRVAVLPGVPLFPGAPAFAGLADRLRRGPVYFDVHTADAPAGRLGGVLRLDSRGYTRDWSRANRG